MKWIITAGLAGWAGIVALAWNMADHRIARCYYLENDCIIRAAANRDAVLTGGLTVALVAMLGVAVLSLRLKRTSHRIPREANQAGPKRLK